MKRICMDSVTYDFTIIYKPGSTSTKADVLPNISVSSEDLRQMMTNQKKKTLCQLLVVYRIKYEIPIQLKQI